jgi:hypothetical protein
MVKADITRTTFDPDKHYSGVFMQQGRVQLDADWNEQVEIQRRHLLVLARDLIGEHGGPKADAGFRVGVGRSGRSLTIGAGRYYVDGLLAENGQRCAYDAQPYLPTAPDLLRAAQSRTGTQLAYLDVWEREVTFLDDPALREVGLGGPDTCVRRKVVWQVRLRSADGFDLGGESTRINRKRAGRLNVFTTGNGYRGAENHLYRVEIHRSGGIGTATFKWSRDNGSVVALIERLEGRLLTIDPRVLRAGSGFESGQWVEINNDAAGLDGEAGDLRMVEAFDDAAGTMTLNEAPSMRLEPRLHPKVRRWDQVDGGDGEEPIAAHRLPLEDGIEVQFAAGTYRTGDYWLIPARTVGGAVEWPGADDPEPQPPRRTVHHRCALAELEFDDKRRTWRVLDDRRRIFAPLAG